MAIVSGDPALAAVTADPNAIAFLSTEGTPARRGNDWDAAFDRAAGLMNGHLGGARLATPPPHGSGPAGHDHRFTDLAIRAYEGALQPKRLFTSRAATSFPYVEAFEPQESGRDWFVAHLRPQA